MQPAAIDHIPPEFAAQVLSPLARAGRTLRRYLVVEGLVRCAVMLVLFAAAELCVDRLLLLGQSPRVVILFAAVVLLAYQFWTRVVRAARLRIDPNDLAALVDRRNPHSRDRLVSAVAFATGPLGTGSSPALVRRLIEETLAGFDPASIWSVLRHERYHRYLRLGMAVIALVMLSTAVMPATVATFLARSVLLHDVPWPSAVRLTLEGARGDRLRWPLGDHLRLVVTADEEVPRGLRAELETQPGETIRRDMALSGTRQFILDYGPLPRSMRVRFLTSKFGADEPSRWFLIEAVERPAVREATIEVTPPAYSRLPAFRLNPQHAATADVLRGSVVTINAVTNKPVKHAWLRTAAARVEAEMRVEGRKISARWQPAGGGTYFFDLADAAGLSDTQPVTYQIRLANDPPPKAGLSLPGVGELVTASAVLNLAVTCEDNLGLSTVELVRRVISDEGAGTAATPVMTAEPLPGCEVGQLKYTFQKKWPLAPLGLSPADRLLLSIRAYDEQPGTPPAATRPDDPAATSSGASSGAIGESRILSLRVVTPEELLAELSRREDEWRREFEQIIKSQEQIKSRTLDLNESAAQAKTSASLTSRYAEEERMQRQQANRVKTVRRQFEQILAELEVNQLAPGTVRRRLESGVIAPLTALANTDIPAAADLLEDLRRAWRADRTAELSEAQSQIVRKMYGVLAQMLKWEGYNEVVILVRDLLRQQGEVSRQTEVLLEREIERLFGDEPASQPAR